MRGVVRVWFRRKHASPPPAPEPIDHTLAASFIKDAVQAHQAAQEQATQARQAVAELRQVNIRNGFAPAIESTIIQRLGGAT
jgi:hypothetical protein